MKEQINHLSIPIELIQYYFKAKELKQFRLFLLLKAYSNGKVKLIEENKNFILDKLGISTKSTLYTQINKAKKLGLVGYDRYDNVVFVRSWKYLYKTLKIKNRKSVLLEKEYFSNFEHFQSFCFAAALLPHIKKQKRRIYSQERKYGRSKQREDDSSLSFSTSGKKGERKPYTGLSCEIIAGILGVTKGQASKYKKNAAKHGFLTAKKKYNVLSFNANKYQELKFIASQKLGYSSDRIKLYQGTVWEQSYDELIMCQNFIMRHKRKSHLI